MAASGRHVSAGHHRGRVNEPPNADARVDVRQSAFMNVARRDLIGVVAREVLGPLGVSQRRRSRVWLDDHGWWLVTVEFQPSVSKGLCYLNVGYQHLWVERNHVVFEDHGRPMGGTATVDATDERAVRSMVGHAKSAIEDLRDRHGEGNAALLRLAQDSHDDLNAGIAAAMVGDGTTATRKLSGIVHDADRGVAKSYLDSLSRGEVSDHARRIVEATRRHLGLDPTPIDWTA